MNDDHILNTCGIYVNALLALCLLAVLFGCHPGGPVDAPSVVNDNPQDFALGAEEQELVGVVGLDPNPLTFWWYSTEEEFQPRLPTAIEGALFRWNAAACLDLDISLNAHHWVRFKDITNSGNIGGSWDSTRIRLDTDLPLQFDQVALMHEICHLLRRSNGHAGDMCQSPFSEHEKITEADLTEVCAARDCECFIPE